MNLINYDYRSMVGLMQVSNRLDNVNFSKQTVKCPHCQDAVGEFEIRQPLKLQSVIFAFLRKVFPLTRRYCVSD